MPKLHRKMSFPDALDKKARDSALVIIIDAISREGWRYPSVLALTSKARRFVARPDIALFKEICSPALADASCEHEFYLLVQVAALFKKRNALELGIDKRDVALKTFVRSERLCAVMNEKLRRKDDPDYRERAVLIHKMQRKISSVLGSRPSLSEMALGFGPGTNVGCSKNTSVRMKLTSDATATEYAMCLFKAIAPSLQVWPGLANVKLVDGSYWTSVSKTSLTDRGINVEPLINSYLQKGVGAEIRARLRNIGIDLTDQSVNQRLARLGSIHGNLATIDLSMASDMICYMLVMELLPWDWFLLLDDIRSPVCTLPNGKKQILEKFSSMGNGATFELESLIFWAVLAVCCDEGDTISVYGDDLICPSDKYGVVCRSLELLGFIVNKDKSFNTGPFRESCGKDFWNGTDVRPCFIKDELSMKEIYRLHNYFVRTGRLSELPALLLKCVPSECRTFGPDGFGDGHLLWDQPPRPVRDKRGWQPYHVFKTWTAKPRLIRNSLDSDYGAMLYKTTCHRTDPSAHYVPAEESILIERSSSPRYKLTTVRVPAAL